MRLNVASLRRRVKGKLHVEFGRQELTSYSGLELLRRYLRQQEVPGRLRAACAGTGGDYGGGRLALVILALFYVGARRLEHLRYLGGEPLIARFCGLARIPTARTVLGHSIGAIVPFMFPHLRGRDPRAPRAPKRTIKGAQRRDFRKRWLTATRAAGVPGRLRHDLRRTAVRNLVGAGVSEHVAITGHKTRSVFDRYDIVSPADLQEATRRLAGITTGITATEAENPAR